MWLAYSICCCYVERIENSGTLTDFTDESFELAQPTFEHMCLAQFEGLLQLLAKCSSLYQCQIRNGVLMYMLIEIFAATEMILQQLNARRCTGVQIGTDKIQTDAQ